MCQNSAGYASSVVGHFAYFHVRRIAHLINAAPQDLPRVSGRYQLLLMQNMRSTYFHSQQVPHSLNETGGNERIGKYRSRMPNSIRIFFGVVRSYLYVISQFRISVLKCLVMFFFCRPASRSGITSFSV